MNTEWIIEAKCPQKEGSTLEETARTCTECSYKIWNHPISALGSNSAMCSITLGKLADELDSIAYKIDALKEFTGQNLSPTERIRTLERVKEYAKKKRWRFAGRSPTQTIDKLNTFIEFCQRAEAEGFNILQRRSQHMMNAKVKQALERIVQRFEEGDVPEAIAYSMFPIPNIPASRWSLLNRTFMFLSGTGDARGFRQWNEVGRYVKKGSKSFTILAPRFVKKQTEDEEESEPVLAGFLAVPVFKVEDTDGQPLDYQNIELPELPLMEVAQEWGISVKAVPGNYHYSGYFSQDKREIGLASKEETVFFHELAHYADFLIMPR